MYMYKIIFFFFSKSTWGKQPVEDIPNFTCICGYVFICVTPPGHTENDTDLKFGTHAPIDLTEKQVFVEKMTPEAASLEKLPCHVDFPHISLIALSSFFSTH